MFNFLIVCYLFLGGIGAGLCVVLSVIGLMVPRSELVQNISLPYRNFFTFGYATSTLVLIAAALCLLADTGNFEALWHLFFSGKVTYLSVGAYMIVAAILISLTFAYLWRVMSSIQKVKRFRVFQIIAVAIGFIVAVYTGLFLAGIPAVPFWNGLWLPMLFLFSSLSCGLVCALIVGQMSGVSLHFENYFRRMVAFDALILVIEMVCVVGLVLSALFFGETTSSFVAARTSALALIVGEFAWLFWGGAILLGLIIAFLFDLMIVKLDRITPGHPYFALPPALCVFIGAFALRFCIVMAGRHPVASFIGA